jgi:hypothetical protein
MLICSCSCPPERPVTLGEQHVRDPCRWLDGSGAVDYEGRFCVGNVRDASVRALWAVLGTRRRRLHREHRWAELLPALCRGCGDWQVAWANYDEQEQAAHTHPFWFYDRGEPLCQAW